MHKGGLKMQPQITQLMILYFKCHVHPDVEVTSQIPAGASWFEIEKGILGLLKYSHDIIRTLRETMED